MSNHVLFPRKRERVSSRGVSMWVYWFEIWEVNRDGEASRKVETHEDKEKATYRLAELNGDKSLEVEQAELF